MNISANIKKLLDEMESLKNRLGLKYDIDIVAVTKTRTVEEMREAIQAGMDRIGENRVQEAESKFPLLDLPVEKRLIGHLQENKANKAAVLFDCVDSLDSIKTARRLNNRCSELGKVMPVLIEINTSGEATKNGLEAEQTEEFVHEILNLKSLSLQGLMTIGPLTDDEARVRQAFQDLYRLREKLRSQFPSLSLHTLSMGMSGDYQLAIEEGSTMIRPGTLLFGHRDYNV